MSDTNNADRVTCMVCGTEMVLAAKEMKLDGGRKMDGSTTLGGFACPKCHPDLTESK